jgi:hypothetical protein
LASGVLAPNSNAAPSALRGAYFEVVSDLLGSIGVIVAGLIMLTTGWYYADPLFSVIIGLFILPRTWKLLVEAVDVLLEATPARINVAEVEKAMLAGGGVATVHDLHILDDHLGPRCAGRASRARSGHEPGSRLAACAGDPRPIAQRFQHWSRHPPGRAAGHRGRAGRLLEHRPLSPANFRQKTNQNQKATNPCPTFTNIKRLKWMNASTPAKKSTTRAFTQFMTA